MLRICSLTLAMLLLVACGTLPPVPGSTVADPRRPEADHPPLLRQALQAAAAGALPAAEELLQQVLAQHPDNALAWTNLGLVQARSGADAAAMQALDRALALVPGACAALVQRALLHRAAGRVQAAWQDNSTCLATAPSHGPALYQQAVLADLYLGDASRAAALYGRYLSATGDQRVAPWLQLAEREAAQAATVVAAP